MTRFKRDLFYSLVLDNIKISELTDSLIVIGKKADSSFEENYLAVRKTENRVLTDDEVLQLPMLPKKHQHYKEWVLRKQSLNRFFNYLHKNPVNGPVLDIGCGNGWFTAKISQSTKEVVVGIDVNQEELLQACRLFQKENLALCYADIFEPSFRNAQFAMITLNSSVQYFESLPILLQRLNQLLLPDGKIHLIDSPFYRETDGAKERSRQYYNSLGHGSFANQYYFRSWKELDGLPYTIQYKPPFLSKKLGKSPFPWVIIHSQNKGKG